MAPGATREGIRAILNALPAMVGYWDADLRNRMANDAYVDFFGLAPGEIHGRHISELLGPELYALNRPYMERALAGEPQLFDREIVDPTGARRYTQASYVPDVVDGEVRGFFVLVTDITARRVAEQALAAAEARFRLAFAGSPVGMGLMDADGLLVEVNPALTGILGRSAAELRGRSLADFVVPDHRAEERDRIASLLSRRLEHPTAERRMLRSDGSEIWAIISLGLADAGDDGPVLAIGQVQDMTERRRAEDELRRSRERLAEAERVAQIGSWEWDTREDDISWSDGLFAIYRLTPDEFDPTREGALQRIYPEDRALVARTIEGALADRSSFTLEYRILRSDGRVRTLRSRGEVAVDDAGEPVRLVGTVQDVSDLKLAREALASTSADLHRRAVELEGSSLGGTADQQPEHQALTGRQLEILRLVAAGLTNAAIAERLIISEATVKWHVKQILRRTASSNRAEAVARVLGGPGRA